MSEKTNYFVHESSYVDDGVKVGKHKIWHFSHVQSDSKSCYLDKM